MYQCGREKEEKTFFFDFPFDGISITHLLEKDFQRILGSGRAFSSGIYHASSGKVCVVNLIKYSTAHLDVKTSAQMESFVSRCGSGMCQMWDHFGLNGRIPGYDVITTEVFFVSGSYEVEQSLKFLWIRVLWF